MQNRKTLIVFYHIDSYSGIRSPGVGISSWRNGLY
jgi:hypothetical protein